MCARLQAGDPGRVWQLTPTEGPGGGTQRVDVRGALAAGSVSMVRALGSAATPSRKRVVKPALSGRLRTGAPT
jgi:hypothetical protein